MMLRLTIGAALWLWPTVALAAGDRPADEQIVNCVDRERQSVNRLLASECAGEIVTDEAAEAIKNEREQYLRAALSRQPMSANGRLRTRKLGSGFFVARNGHLVTNLHVVEGCTVITLETERGEGQAAGVVASDPANDLALLRTEAAAPELAVFDPARQAPPGTAVMIVGYPELGLPTIERQIDQGHLIERHDAEAESPSAIAFRGAVRSGHSGGPLLDADGRVIGLIKAKIDTVRVYARTGELIRDIGLAVPAATVIEFLERNGVAASVAAAAPPTGQRPDAKAVGAFLARISCWR